MAWHSSRIKPLIAVMFFACTVLVLMNWLQTSHFKSDVLYSHKAYKSQSPEEYARHEKVRAITKCVDRNVEFKLEQRESIFVFLNFVKATRTFKCHESVTYTTHGDYSFLDNVPKLINRWLGPISIGLFAPGTDFEATLKSIAYLRSCESLLIKEYVTFHVFTLSGHFASKKPLINLYEDDYDCNKGPPYFNLPPESLYRHKHNLTYPINIARNIARQTASTHFVFASDIELYPSPNFIKKFLSMIADNPQYEQRKTPRVYALAIFEVIANGSLPENKTMLQQMVKERKAFLFHRTLCPACHAVPKHTEWMALPETKGLHVFTVAKRTHRNKVWEAFYVGTHAVPLFDERLTWEGQSNKMSQGFSLCLLDYDYMVLDNAFLVHKPGIKKAKEQLEKYGAFVRKTNSLIKSTIKPELIKLYGFREQCYL